MATTTDSVPDVTSETPDLRRASTAPTEESASGVGLTEHPAKQAYQPPPEDEDEEMEEEEVPTEEPPAPPQHEMVDAHPEDDDEAENLSPTSDYLMGIMAEFRKLEGKLSTLLNEHAKVKGENEDLRNSPPEPDPNTLRELESLNTKYNKVKKLYFQKETQLEEFAKENEALKADTDDLKTENEELNRDLNILVKERDTLTTELEVAVKERDSLSRQRATIERERDTIARERDAVLSERDTIRRVKEEAIHEKQEAIIDRDEARQDREALQNRIKDLEDEVAKLQANSSANGIRDKRQSAPTGGHGSTGSDYPQEILKLKYDKVKRLYYEQQKTIAHLEDRLRVAESPKDDGYVRSSRPESLISRSNSKGKQRASYESPERSNATAESADSTPQRRRSVRASGKRGGSVERDRMSIGTDSDV